MVARRIELRSAKNVVVNDKDDYLETEEKPKTPKKKMLSQSMTWVMVIMISLVAYHCYDSYTEQLGLEEE